MSEINNQQDVMDSRDIVARLDELREERDNFVLGSPDGEETPNPKAWAEENPDEADELAQLEAFVSDMEGCGDWSYGTAVIRDSYFEQYAQDLAEETGAIPEGAKWPVYCIDWEQAANELKHDYSSAEFDGVTYWARA